MKTYSIFIKLACLHIILTAVGFAQTGLVYINRDIGGQSIRSPQDFFSHTFVAFVENGTVRATASWGTNGFWGGWTRNASLDSQAQLAFGSGQFQWAVAGGSLQSFDTVFMFAGSSLGHPNLGVFLNCKNEAASFAAMYDDLLQGKPLSWDNGFATQRYALADMFNMSGDQFWGFIDTFRDPNLWLIMRQRDPELRDLMMTQYHLQKFIERQNEYMQQ